MLKNFTNSFSDYRLFFIYTSFAIAAVCLLCYLIIVSAFRLEIEAHNEELSRRADLFPLLKDVGDESAHRQLISSPLLSPAKRPMEQSQSSLAEHARSLDSSSFKSKDYDLSSAANQPTGPFV
eukprot:GFYU01006591.1.p1 GENE.GFYU01006591.1~~GFYU01006591.1.p1  ORF type:complete len:123 (-),score=25.98 GFYU01006591.1:178-546(-)